MISGATSTSASRRGKTRWSIGLTPRTRKASISSPACMVASCAANEAPTRPARIMPVIKPASSRTMPTVTMSAMKVGAPILSNCAPPM